MSLMKLFSWNNCLSVVIFLFGILMQILCKIKLSSKKAILIDDKITSIEDNRNAGELLNIVKINKDTYNSLAVLRKDMLIKNLIINDASVEVVEQVKKNA